MLWVVTGTIAVNSSYVKILFRLKNLYLIVKYQESVVSRFHQEQGLVFITGPLERRNRRPTALPPSMAQSEVFVFSPPAAAPLQAPTPFNAPNSLLSMNFPCSGPSFFE